LTKRVAVSARPRFGEEKRIGSTATGDSIFDRYLQCGVIANVGIAAAVFQRHYAWWLSALAGIAVGLVWNYAVCLRFSPGVAHLD
jgi:putative flippase GtrA